MPAAGIFRAPGLLFSGKSPCENCYCFCSPTIRCAISGQYAIFHKRPRRIRKQPYHARQSASDSPNSLRAWHGLPLRRCSRAMCRQL